MADDTPITKHDTLVLERTYPASRERVFAAWSGPDIRKVCDVPGEDWEWELAELASAGRVLHETGTASFSM